MTITDFGVAIVSNDSHLSRWVVEQRTLAVADGFCRLFAQYIPVSGVVVDVGACIGDHTVTYSDMVGPSGRVIAFEPNPVAAECLEYNMASRANVLVYRLALGERNTSGRIEQDDNLGGSRFVAMGDQEPRLSPSVAMARMDSFWWLKNLGRFNTIPDRLDFLKIDAEGWEPEILRGARETIRRLRPTMLIEVNRAVLAAQGKTDAQIFDELTALGYSWRPCEPHLSMDLEMIDILATIP